MVQSASKNGAMPLLPGSTLNGKKSSELVLDTRGICFGMLRKSATSSSTLLWRKVAGVFSDESPVGPSDPLVFAVKGSVASGEEHTRAWQASRLLITDVYSDGS